MNSEELRDEVLAISNNQSRIYIFFKKTKEIVGIPVRPGVRRVFAKQGYSARFVDCYSSYMLDLDKEGRLCFVKHRSHIVEDDSALSFKNKDEKYTNIRQSTLAYYNLLTPEEVENINSLHRLYGLVPIAIYDEKMKPIKGLETLYAEHSGLVEFLTYDHENSDYLRKRLDYLDLIRTPGDANAYLSLLQTSRHMYGKGVAKMGIETTKKIILDNSGLPNAVIAGQMIPIDNQLRYDFGVDETDGGIMFNGKKIYADSKYMQHYYALARIYNKLGFDVKFSKFKGMVPDEGEINYVEALHPLVVARFVKDYYGSLPAEFLKPDENKPIEM